MVEREEEKERGKGRKREGKMRQETEHLSVGANLVPHTHCLTFTHPSLLGGQSGDADPLPLRTTLSI